MKWNLLFGSKTHDMDSIHTELSACLKLRFKAGEGLYKGGDYYSLDMETGEYVLIQNNRELEDELAEEAFPDVPLLIYVTGTSDPDVWKDRIVNQLAIGEFLRQKE